MSQRVTSKPRGARLNEKINAAHSDAALKWHRGLRKTIFSLEAQPNQRPVTRKKNELRHLLYGRNPSIYRVIFRVMGSQKCVEVLHIRHGARPRLKASDLA